MANNLRNKTARVSFFAFQDMITTVTGVLMIIMMMLSLDLTQQASSASTPATKKIQEEVAQAREQLKENQKTLAELRLQLSTQTNQIFVIPEPDRTGKQSVLVVLSATNGWVTRIGQTNRTEFRVTGGRTSFSQILSSCDAAHDRLVFYVRPSGVNHFEVCRELAKKRAFNIGYDAADEDAQYILSPH